MSTMQPFLMFQGGHAEKAMNFHVYGFSERFAGVADRFGVSWQLNLP